MSTAVRLAQCNGNLRNCSFAVCVHQLCTVGDDAAVFLIAARHKSRNINQSYQRNVEAVAEPDETGALARRFDVEATCEERRLVGNNTYRLSVETGKTYNDVLCIVLVNFLELAVINDELYDVLNIVRLVGVVGKNCIQCIFHSVNRVGAFNARSLLLEILRHIRDKSLQGVDCIFLVVSHKVSNTRLRCVNHCAAEVVFGDSFASNGLGYLWTSYEHIAIRFRHDNIVGESR